MDDLLARHRKFLHDLATPLTLLSGHLEAALEYLNTDVEKNVEAINKVKKSINSVQKLTDLLKEQRNQLPAK